MDFKCEGLSIKKENLKPNDIIIVYFDLDIYSISEIGDIHTAIKSCFPLNEVIVIPNKFNLSINDREKTKKVLKTYLQDLK